MHSHKTMFENSQFRLVHYGFEKNTYFIWPYLSFIVFLITVLHASQFNLKDTLIPLG